MSFDERDEFLRQSIQSHDRQIGELVERMDRMSGRVDRVAASVESLTSKLDRFVQVTQPNFDRLTTAMMSLTEHVVAHERGITKLHPTA